MLQVAAEDVKQSTKFFVNNTDCNRYEVASPINLSKVSIEPGSTASGTASGASPGPRTDFVGFYRAILKRTSSQNLGNVGEDKNEHSSSSPGITEAKDEESLSSTLFPLLNKKNAEIAVSNEITTRENDEEAKLEISNEEDKHVVTHEEDIQAIHDKELAQINIIDECPEKICLLEQDVTAEISHSDSKVQTRLSLPRSLTLPQSLVKGAEENLGSNKEAVAAPVTKGKSKPAPRRKGAVMTLPILLS